VIIIVVFTITVPIQFASVIVHKSFQVWCSYFLVKWSQLNCKDTLITNFYVDSLMVLVSV